MFVTAKSYQECGWLTSHYQKNTTEFYLQFQKHIIRIQLMGIVTFRMVLGPQSPSITSTLSRRNFHGLKLITGSVSKWPYFQLEASCHIRFTNISFEMEIYVDNPSGAAVDFFFLLQ